MQYPSAMSTPVLSPFTAAATGRVVGIDFVRGMALLGITVVNVQLFAAPFERLLDPALPDGVSAMGAAFQWFNITFCAGKFYPLYSLLFGVGLAIMLESAVRRGASFGWTFARRLLMLALFGLLHVLLLWYGDILLLYAAVGIIMIPLARCSARTLAIAAGVSFTVGVLGACLFALLGMMAAGAESADAPTQAAGAGSEPLWEILRTYQPGSVGMDPRLNAFEQRVFREGPFVEAMALRVFFYVFSTFFMALIVVWQVAACFCAGAALWKAGFFAGRTPRLERAMVWTGLLIGLPMQIAAAWLMMHRGEAAYGAATVLMQVGGPMVSMAYLALALRWATRQADSGSVRAVARLGAMGLTGYLGVSLLMSFTMQHWGLGLFDSVPMEWWWVLVPGVWLAMVAFASLWSKWFAAGPLEWAWKSFTHLKRSPMLRAEG
jgi:uncharacterized protein